jgi:hypothetical protein
VHVCVKRCVWIDDIQWAFYFRCFLFVRLVPTSSLLRLS